MFNRYYFGGQEIFALSLSSEKLRGWERSKIVDNIMVNYASEKVSFEDKSNSF
jgi:hypothetical protein